MHETAQKIQKSMFTCHEYLKQNAKKIKEVEILSQNSRKSLKIKNPTTWLGKETDLTFRKKKDSFNEAFSLIVFAFLEQSLDKWSIFG